MSINTMNWGWIDYRRLLGEQKKIPKKQRLALSEKKLTVGMAHNLVTSLANQIAVFEAYLTAIWFLWRFLNNSWSDSRAVTSQRCVVSDRRCLCSSLQ